eukprot:CAMPEP_0202349826 /NCGR_PEP_ID=MMETSP1126-20121109/7151_1 /ASSEMBLY_ACC=CAM_ASM_000457 /TAXON_ID=3047 /ORGANISM="Dunaliella tertiolecta, Strain CCMP1320" /LENGTH=526 /DNA_ID=CAMNT_0048941691 /DNA_START=210 /DNA_END=1790 /DNA_ORIENTATION=+
MCVNCIRSQVDITEGVQKQVTVLWCKDCGRYLQPPKHWMKAELESKELLTFCIKKIRGLQKVKLVDAGFIWTEPHSKRLKVKLTIQAEVFNGAILQQSFVVDFVVENHMCPDCNRFNANPNSWTACAQVRQHVYHKRTFLFLEQLLLKYGVADNCLKITDIHEGLDFFFGNRAHALKLIDFLQSVVPCRFRADKQLVSHDTHNNTYNYKYTFSVEIAPVCKDDLICLPQKLSTSLGGIGPLVMCSKVSNQISLIDFCTLRTAHMNADVYWRMPYKAIASSKQLTEYVVLDIELEGPANGKFALAEAQVARKSDFGRNDNVFFCRTHLGHLLKPGDTALGYDTSSLQVVAQDFEAFVDKGGVVPDVVLVRKSYEEKRKKRRDKGLPERVWKLRHLHMDVDEAAGVSGKGGKAAQERDAQERDRQRFLEELEEDPEMRQRINVYKNEEALARAQQMAARQQQQQQGPVAAKPAGLEEDMGDDEDDEDGDLPQVPLEELLDDLEALGLDEGRGGVEAGWGGDDEEMEDA